MSGDEKIMAGSLLVTVGLWIFGSKIGVGGVASAIVGLAALLITGVISWKECLAEGPAWDTLTWFAALIAMADYLNKYGLIKWFSGQVVAVSAHNTTPTQPLSLLLCSRSVYAL